MSLNEEVEDQAQAQKLLDQHPDFFPSLLIPG